MRPAAPTLPLSNLVPIVRWSREMMATSGVPARSFRGRSSTQLAGAQSGQPKPDRFRDSEPFGKFAAHTVLQTDLSDGNSACHEGEAFLPNRPSSVC